MRIAAIAVLAVALAWTGWRLADVERQRYALIVGLCWIDTAQPHSIDCLKTAEPRTNRLWDLYYGLIP